MGDELIEFQDFALELRAEARHVLQEELSCGPEVSEKADRSFVTSIDTKIEQRLSERIQRRYPEHGIIGEEFGETRTSAEYVWTLDPIDGTEELVHRTVTYGTIIGLLKNRKPVFGLIDHERLDLCVYGGKGIGVHCNGERVPSLGEVSTSRRLYIGTRAQFLRVRDEAEIFTQAIALFPNVRIFCTCYSFTSMVLNQADVCLEYNLKVWDLAAAEALIEAVGGVFVRFGEKKMKDDPDMYGAVFGKPAAVSELCEFLKIG